ncbi:MAG: NADH-quinone oxidoreductase subunit NuoE [Bacillota bacterium]|nr:NADH-quinone oxidoreductase subunit NuoE [Bacillota bacterium]HPQ03458.1 NADH-quinone oxidoreductase subunit NuoE [Bacillota bacterium]HQD79537.1 NADH-quinone oxidoreductase subunit NuoE [Bacillota bacterium]
MLKMRGPVGPEGSGVVCECDDVFLTEVQRVVSVYKERPEDLVQALHDVQSLRNYLPREALRVVARTLDVPESRVYGVATFYSMFSTSPRGRHIIRICESAPCHVAGAAEIINSLLNELGVEMGGTTSDGIFTVETSSCLGVCGVAPAIMIDDTVYGNLVSEDLPAVLRRYR